MSEYTRALPGHPHSPRSNALSIGAPCNSGPKACCRPAKARQIRGRCRKCSLTSRALESVIARARTHVSARTRSCPNSSESRILLHLSLVVTQRAAPEVPKPSRAHGEGAGPKLPPVAQPACTCHATRKCSARSIVWAPSRSTHVALRGRALQGAMAARQWLLHQHISRSSPESHSCATRAERQIRGTEVRRAERATWRPQPAHGRLWPPTHSTPGRGCP